MLDMRHQEFPSCGTTSKSREKAIDLAAHAWHFMSWPQQTRHQHEPFPVLEFLKSESELYGSSKRLLGTGMSGWILV